MSEREDGGASYRVVMWKESELRRVIKQLALLPLCSKAEISDHQTLSRLSAVETNFLLPISMGFID